MLTKYAFGGRDLWSLAHPGMSLQLAALLACYGMTVPKSTANPDGIMVDSMCNLISETKDKFPEMPGLAYNDLVNTSSAAWHLLRGISACAEKLYPDTWTAPSIIKTDDAIKPVLRFEASKPTLVRAQEDASPGLLYFPATLQAFGETGQVLLSETTLGDEPQGHGWAGRNFVSPRNGTGKWVELTPSYPNVNQSALRPGQWMVRNMAMTPSACIGN
eukprot:SAG25_NODE_1230_length_3555_cov_1.522859_1_plen_217_part_00